MELIKNEIILITLIILNKLFFGYGLLNARNVNTIKKFENISSILDELLKNYDIRLRPKFGVDTLDVNMEVRIASFDAISEVNMDYTLTIYLNQYWRDERLIFGDENDYLTLMGDFAENIWLPDTFLANDKYAYLHDVTEKNKMIKIYGNGNIIYGMRFTTTLACMMDLHNYPMDSQNCTIEIESYGYTNREVNICWKDERHSVLGLEKVSLPQFRIVSYKTSTYLEETSTGQYTRLSLSFLLERHIGYFIFQTYLPSILIVMLSWVSFWINHEATSARVALGITTVLTMTTISTGVRSSLPRISYVKAIDIYLVTCFVFVFAALLEYAAVNYSHWSERAKKRKQINEIINQNLEQCYGKKDSGQTAAMVSQHQQPAKETSFSHNPSSLMKNSIDTVDVNRASPLPWLYSKTSKASSMFNNIDLENPRCSTYIDEESADFSSKTLSRNHSYRRPNWPDHHQHNHMQMNEIAEQIAVAAAAAAAAESDPMIRSSLKGSRKERGNSLRSRRRRRVLHSARTSLVKMARNKFEQDEADVLNIYAKVNGGELLGSSASYGGILNSSKLTRNQQKRIWQSLTFKAREIKRIIPTVKDINIIDKYSRLAFPNLFLFFNICYWCFYFYQSTYLVKETY